MPLEFVKTWTEKEIVAGLHENAPIYGFSLNGICNPSLNTVIRILCDEINVLRVRVKELEG